MAFNCPLYWSRCLNISPQQYCNKGYQSNLRIKKTLTCHAIPGISLSSLEDVKIRRVEQLTTFSCCSLLTVEGDTFAFLFEFFVLIMGLVNMSIVKAGPTQPAVGSSVTVDDCKATLVISQPTQIHVGTRLFFVGQFPTEGDPRLTAIIRA